MSAQNTELLEITNQLKQKFPMFFTKGDLWVNTLNLEDQNRINSIIRWPGAQTYSPLRIALHIGSQELMKLLIDQGLRLTEKEERAEKVNPHITDYFRYLLEKCDKVDEMSSEDRAVWLKMLDHENVEDIEKLLKAKQVNINAVDSSGKTLLHIAAEKSVPRVIEILIENGAIVDARDKHNLTPLCYAIDKENTAKSTILAEHGADANVFLNGAPCNVYTNAWDPRRKREFDNAVATYKRKMSYISVPSSNGNFQTPAQLLGQSLSEITNVASPSSVPKTEHHQSHKSPAKR